MKRIKFILSFVVISLIVILINMGIALGKDKTWATPETPDIQGPFISDPIYPAEVGDLRELPQINENDIQSGVIPLKYTPGTSPKGPSSVIVDWKDPIAQTMAGEGSMPAPLRNFPGISFGDLGQGYHPPDTNGDVGPNYYIQAVNVSFAIYDKSNGNEIVHRSFDQLFSGAQSPCKNKNSGDPVVVYDRFANRWLISDFSLPSGGPYAECIAISKTDDPVIGGWWLYTVPISTNAINDYPKVGVWADAYYFSFNMFTQPGDGWGGVEVWAMDRAKMLEGNPMTPVHFTIDANSGYSSLLPSHALSLPPIGSPNYFVSVAPSNQLLIWKFHVDFTTPVNSTFIGPSSLPVVNFAIAASVPQLGTSQFLDSLSFRPMMQLIYRKIGEVEALWMNHSVASRGVAGIRWYEVRNPGAIPTLFQQGTYNPDLDHRWMGSLAVDQDGNVAVGYSVSSSNMYPAIRYAGRQAGEVPGLLTQAESVLIQGTGSQNGTNRWGDYSSMSVDVVDDCTFWYTTEYLGTTGRTWLTRIGSFKFPSCGQPKGSLSGYVRNSVTSQVIPGIKVIASSSAQTKVVLTDASGFYTMTLLGGTYNLIGGPLPPGYPISATINSLVVTVGSNTSQDISLTPKPYLISGVSTIDDNVPYAKHNGYPEPGERGLRFTLSLTNTGAITATDITARLTSSSPGVIIETADVSYPDIPPGTARVDTLPFIFSLQTNIVCGTDLAFRVTVNSSDASYIIDLTLNASVLLPRENVLFNNVETSQTGWSTGGIINNTWVTTTVASKSPTHSWSDSPGQYTDNTNSYLRSPALDLSGKRHAKLGGWYKYALEAGYDYVYLEYSTNGGATWNATPLLTLNGTQTNWLNQIVDTPMLDGQSNIAFRYHIVTDQGVVMDGIYIDDIALSHEPFACTPTLPGTPILELPYNNSKKTNPVTFQWSDSGNGLPPTGYVFSVEGVTTITFTSPITTTTISLPLGFHQWNIVALNEAGKSPATNPWIFEVLDFKTGVPGTPILLAPTDGTHAPSQSILFHWTDSGGTGGTPEGYVFSLDGMAVITFTNPVNDYPFQLIPGSHTWTVQAYNSYGYSEYADSWIIHEPFWLFLPFITN